MKAVTGGGPSPLTASNVSARHRCLTGDGIPYNPSKVSRQRQKNRAERPQSSEDKKEDDEKKKKIKRSTL
uniref:Uncharacterized protein n=1 Tax=Oryza sativa subsp. japonica TaxID=39947 RepID=Q6YZG1_ORYSJ|nr:hypothetical protein [Oryza sativa Japonica Group]BAD13160.1 hypothetical protein [Oryza sativa Japonica Group]